MTRANLKPALDRLAGKTYTDADDNLLGCVYRADETRKYYAVDIDAIADLAERLDRNDADAYSRWCAEDGYTEGFVSEDEAALDAGWIDDPEYDVKVLVRSVAEFPGDDDIETDPLSAYIGVDVMVDGSRYSVGTMVGVRESEQGSCRASGAGVRPFCDTWQIESSDTNELPGRLMRNAVLAALHDSRHELWTAVELERE
jgi:hypothetical protein